MSSKKPFEIARPIVTYLIAELEKLGYKADSITYEDGEDDSCASPEEAIDTLFNVDYAEINFSFANDPSIRAGWIVFIPDNGEDVVCDYPGAGTFYDAVETLLETLEHLHCGKCQHVFREDEAGSLIETGRCPETGQTWRLHLLACPQCGSDDVQSRKHVPEWS